MRYILLLTVLAVSVLPVQADVILDYASASSGGWAWFSVPNIYNVASYANSFSFTQDVWIDGYEHYSTSYSVDPDFYRLRLWDNPWDPWIWPSLTLHAAKILTATSATLVQDGIYKVSFSFAPIQLQANHTYLIGLTTNSDTADAGQWFVNGLPYGVVGIAGDNLAGGTMGATQMFQLDGGFGTVPEPATAGLVAVALLAVAARVRRRRP